MHNIKRGIAYACQASSVSVKPLTQRGALGALSQQAAFEVCVSVAEHNNSAKDQTRKAACVGGHRMRARFAPREKMATIAVQTSAAMLDRNGRRKETDD